MRKLLPILGLLAAASPSLSSAQINARMLRQPDVSKTHITFVYAGDIWTVPKAGGMAARLSSPAGEEAFPKFSPDGSRIAFSANYDGNEDVYVMSAQGGVPERVTHHPAVDRLVDWYPDGENLLYASGMKSGSGRFNQLYQTKARGGLPTQLPLAYGEFAALSSDGSEIIFQMLQREFRTWKRYRGGMAPDLWWVDLETFESRRLTLDDANDSLPMWRGSTLYFLSDRDSNKRANLWAVDLAGGEPRQLTHFVIDDVHFPSIGPDEIVFEAAGRLHLLDLASEGLREVEVQVQTDRRSLRPRQIEVAEYFQSATISPSGKRAMVEARGEIFSVPAEHGVVRDLTQTSGAFERHPAWSPDGKTLAYFSDRTGEYELTVRPADGSGEERTVTDLGPGYRYAPWWSPDSKRVVFVDQSFAIQIADIESGEVRVIDRALRWSHGPLAGFEASWSADGRWLTYHRDVENGNNAVFIYDTESGDRHQLTAGFYSSSDPVFDPAGDYLYFVQQREFVPSYSTLIEGWAYANTGRLVAVPLRSDVDSPLAPRNDVESSSEAGEKKNDDSTEDSKKSGKGKKGEKDRGDDAEGDSEEAADPAKRVEIDLENFESRVVVLPPEAGNYRNLRAVKGKLVYTRDPRTGSSDKNRPMLFWDLGEREEQTILDNQSGFEIAAKGEKALVFHEGSLAIIDVAASQKLDKRLAMGEMRMTLDPAAEWRQIFNDVWRLERDFFYDPGMHGVNWPALREHYAELLEVAETRWDVNFVIGELIAELNASHAYRSGGDVESEERSPVGVLGADWEIVDGAYRIARIVGGAPWDNEVRSALAEAKGDVEEGDFVLAINGVVLDPARDPWAALQGLAGETVELTVADSADGTGSREVLVVPLRSESRLRNLAWMEANRRRVEEATEGRVGYIYVPNTGIDGQNELVRQFQGQLEKEGLVIDERFNGGGQIPDRFVELLNRRREGTIVTRHGLDTGSTFSARTGPMVMLINYWAGSGGDMFPFLFREAGLGKLIGTRTWGGLIGISGSPGLIDGGNVTVPSFGFYDNNGEWLIEGYGVDPDIEVIDDPGLTARGGDPQLDRAIEEVLKSLATTPPPIARPAYDDRSR